MGWINTVGGAVWELFHRSPSASATPPPSDDFWYAPVGNESASGIRVTVDIALKASALHACVKILAETIASLPLGMFRRLPDGDLVEAPDHPIDDLLRFQPNSWQTAAEFWETMMFHAALNGGGVAQILPGPRGAVDQLIPMFDARVEQREDFELTFDVWDPRTRRRKILMQEEVFRVPGLSGDGIKGIRAVDVAADAIGLGLAQDVYAARVFKNGLNLGGFLVHPHKIGEEAQKNLIHALMLKFAGAGNAHRPMVLQEGMDWKPAGQTAEQAQLAEARKWQIGEVARHLRIPLHMLNVDDQTNRSTVEAQALEFGKYTARPWVTRIQQAIRRDLIIAKGVFEARFDLEELFRGDAKSQAELHSKALGSGGSPAWMTQNEVRRRVGLNRSDDPGANRLGVGTNPRTDGGGQSGETAALPAPATAITDRRLMDLTEAAAERVVRKEVVAVRKAATRFADDGDAFAAWARQFYEGHIGMVHQTLRTGDDVAGAYAGQSLDQVLGAFEAGQIEALLDRWESERAAELAASLLEHAA